METERIALNQRERDRLKVLHEVKQEHLTQVEAARRLKLSDRQVRRMLIRIGERGDGAIDTVRNPSRARQVLPAYGLQACPRTEYLNHKRRLPPTTHGGHFNMAENRTFLLCVDRP